MGEREVNSSLMPAASRRQHPTVSKAMVSAEDPIICVSTKNDWSNANRALTVCLTAVEADEHANNATNDKQEADKIKLPNMFTEGHALMGVKVEEEEQDRARDAAGRSRIGLRSAIKTKVINGLVIQINEEAPGEETALQYGVTAARVRLTISMKHGR